MARAAREALLLHPGPVPPARRPTLLGLKAAIDELLRPVAARIPISPAAITGAGVAAMAAAAAAAASGQLRLAALLVLLSGALDILDGAVAKARGLCSRFGALLDRVADRAADLLILVGLTAGAHVELLAGLVAVGAVLLASYVSACAEAFTGSQVGESLSLRPVRIVLLALGCLAGAPAVVVWALGAIGTVSVVHRLRVARLLLAPGTPGPRG